jgi:hypothetical protein
VRFARQGLVDQEESGPTRWLESYRLKVDRQCCGARGHVRSSNPRYLSRLRAYSGT